MVQVSGHQDNRLAGLLRDWRMLPHYLDIKPGFWLDFGPLSVRMQDQAARMLDAYLAQLRRQDFPVRIVLPAGTQGPVPDPDQLLDVPDIERQRIAARPRVCRPS